MLSARYLNCCAKNDFCLREPYTVLCFLILISLRVFEDLEIQAKLSIVPSIKIKLIASRMYFLEFLSDKIAINHLKIITYTKNSSGFA